eukprot:m.1469012 g.1469012  ORF g.1469012 m.1469012 type:complete len:52 (+) comp25140_c1_seq11:621-776(+)
MADVRLMTCRTVLVGPPCSVPECHGDGQNTHLITSTTLLPEEPHQTADLHC